MVTQAEIEARWLEYVAARESLVSAAFNAGSCASLHGGVHRDDIDRQGRARDRLDAAVRTLAALLSGSGTPPGEGERANCRCAPAAPWRSDGATCPDWPGCGNPDWRPATPQEASDG